MRDDGLARWIRMPAPGQFRGQGDWKQVDGVYLTREFWEECRESGYLPTRIARPSDPAPCGDD